MCVTVNFVLNLRLQRENKNTIAVMNMSTPKRKKQRLYRLSKWNMRGMSKRSKRLASNRRQKKNESSLRQVACNSKRAGYSSKRVASN
jgi:hypothetical protein